VIPKGILLDYGGTLVEERGYDVRAGNEVLWKRAAYRPPNLTFDEVLARARLVTEQVADRRDQFGIETPWPALTRLIHDFLGVRFDDPPAELELAFWKASATTESMPGALGALEEFRSRRIPMGVVSNCSFGSEVLRYELHKHGLAEYLEFIMVSAEYALRKPNPLLFATAAARLGVSPEDIWFIGDRLDYDVAGARAAGMKPVWLRGKQAAETSDAFLSAGGWEEVVDHLRQMA
jgi:putative hydrolase of the HAD superfamily